MEHCLAHSAIISVKARSALPDGQGSPLFLEDNMETTESLIEFCKQNGRVCPNPQHWQQLWDMLPEKHQTGNRWEPSLPLILGAWQEPAMLKMIRLAEQIRWADEHGDLSEIARFLRGLEESDWYHLGD